MDGEYILTSIVSKPFQHSLHEVWDSESEFISVIGASLQQLKEEINLETEQVLITVPDEWCQSVSISIDSDMTGVDGWDLARWTIKQRWNLKDLIYAGRHFETSPESIFGLSIPRKIIEPLKLSISEQGANILWLGTESSVFYGLYPTEGCTVLTPDGSGYKYYKYSPEGFGSGTARFLKGSWVTHPRLGSPLENDLGPYPLMIAGELSPKRKQHFLNLKHRVITPFENINLEGISSPEPISNYLKIVTTAVILGECNKVSLNLLGESSLQPLDYTPPQKVISSSNKIKKNTRKKSRSLVTPDLVKSGKQSILPYLITGIIIVIFLGIIYYNNYYRDSQVLDIEPTILSETENQLIDENNIDEVRYTPLIIKYKRNSQSIIKSVTRVMNSFNQSKITFISISNGILRLDLVGDQTMDSPVVMLGDVSSYELSEIGCCGGYKHGYIIDTEINPMKFQLQDKWADMADLDKVFSFDPTFISIKKLSSRELQDYVQFPIKLRVTSLDYINQILSRLRQVGDNVALEKFLYTSNQDIPAPVGIFYLSIFQKKPHIKTDL